MSIAALLVVLPFAASPARAGDAAAAPPPAAAKAPAPGEVTLEGMLGCGKCSFHEAKACENVLKVKHADASGQGQGKAGEVEDTYLLVDNDVSRANHERVCGPAAPATVTGTITQDKADKPGKKKSHKAARKLLTASAITFK